MRDKNYTERIDTRLTPKQYDRLKKEAKLLGLTMNQLVRNLIDAYVRGK